MGVCGECIASMTLDSATRECTVLMACEARLGWARLLHYITLRCQCRGVALLDERQLLGGVRLVVRVQRRHAPRVHLCEMR